MIIRNFRLCACDNRKNGGFTDIRKADKTYIRNRHQLQFNLIFLCLLSALGKTRSLLCRRCKFGISPASPAAAQNSTFPARAVHIRNNLARLDIAHTRSDRNLNYKVLTAFAVLHVSSAVFAVLCTEESCKLEIKQCVHVFIGKENNIAPPAAVSAVRSAVTDVFLSVEACASVAAVACFYNYPRLINKLHFICSPCGIYIIPSVCIYRISVFAQSKRVCREISANGVQLTISPQVCIA